MRMLDGNLPVYLCWVRDRNAEQPESAFVAVMCRQSNDPDSEEPAGSPFALPAAAGT